MAIRAGFSSLLPLIVLQGLVIALASIITLFYRGEPAQPQATRYLYETHRFILSMLPLLALISISYHAAGLYRCSQIYACLLSLQAYLLILLLSDSDTAFYFNVNGFRNNLYSLVMGPLVPFLYSRIKAVPALNIFSSSYYPPLIKKPLNSVLPSMIVLALIVPVAYAIHHFSAMKWLVEMVGPDSGWSESVFGLSVFVVVINALWTLGIHGSVTLTPWFQTLYDNGQANHQLLEQGLPAVHMDNQVLLYAFVHLGGSGTALALILAIWLAAKSRSKRIVSYAAFPITIFNVNEVLLYGLPVLFNRFMIIPFIVAPLTCMLIAYHVISCGWVPIPTFAPGWTTPPLLGAYLATAGSWPAVALAAFNLAIATAIYVPFIRMWERSQNSLGQRLNEYRTQLGAIPQAPVLNYEAFIRKDAGIDSAAQENQLDAALDYIHEGELELHYQPIVDLDTGRIVEIEALLRLRHPRDGLQAPSFLAILIKTDLIEPIDRWVMGKVIDDWKDWDVGRYPLPRIHINVSPQILLQPDFVDRLIEQSALLPLCVEIVEERLPEDIDRLTAALRELARHNIRISLDDFGVGYSLIARLMQLPINQVKLDSSMLNAAFEHKSAYNLFVGMVGLLKQLHLDVCVEGVERMEHLQLLRQLQVDSVQGFLLSHALPLKQMQALLRSGQPMLDAEHKAGG